MTADESRNEKKPEIVIDEDWKSRVKAEDAAMDEKLRAEKPGKEPQSSEDETEQPKKSVDPSDLPPADLGTLVGMLTTQAMVALGVIAHPESGKPDPEPVLAKHFIDLLGVLEEKTKGNVDEAEASLLESTLHQLRLAYLEATK